MVYVCPNCLQVTVVAAGQYTCPNCGLVVSPVYDDADAAPGGILWLLLELAWSFGLEFEDAYRLYFKFRACRVKRTCAVVCTIYTLLKERGDYVSIQRLVNLVNGLGFKLKPKEVKRALIRSSPYIFRPRPHALVKLYAAKLNIEDIAEKAERLLASARFLGGRDPHLVALAALYIAAEGKLSYYRLAKFTGRSPSRIRDNVLFLLERLR